MKEERKSDQLDSMIENARFGSLTKSAYFEREVEENEKCHKLRNALRRVVLPDLKKVPQ
jgi:hypothetical protein